MSQVELTSLPDLKSELERCKRENKNLRETIGNKLILEEEVNDLKNRLELQKEQIIDNISIKTKLQYLEKELIEYKTVATNYCPGNSIVSPEQLRNTFEKILQKDLILTSETGAAKNEKNVATSQIQELNRVCCIFINYLG